MTNIDPAIVEALGVDRWKTMGVSSVECECGQIVHGPEGLTEFPADEAFRGHIAGALAPLIAAAVDAARAEGDKQGAARVRKAVEAIHRPQPDRAEGYQHLYCMGCWSKWPCQTARALTEATR